MKNLMRFLWLTSLSGVCLLGGLSAQAASFPDVPEDHPNFEAIEYLDEQGVVNGYKDKTFGPDNPVNRAEAMKMILEAMNIDIEGEYELKFDDVNVEDWFFKYVMKAQKMGIVTGYDDGQFKPGNTVNLAETLKMLILTSGNEVVESVDFDIFSDVKPDAWFAPHVLFARDKNLIQADGSGAVYPGQSMTRAAFAEVVYRMMIVKENDGVAFPLDKNWDYFSGETVPFRMKYDESTWAATEKEGEVIFFKADNDLLQFSPERTYPNSASVRVQYDLNANEASQTDYFNNLKSVFTGAQIEEFSIGELSAIEVSYPEDRIVDWYIFLNDSTVLVVYSEYGAGILGYQLQQQIQAMLSTLEYQEIVEKEDYSALKSEILENVLVEGKGLEMIEKTPDALIIETDTIGVGTGPVDYYYSEKLDSTFKYERSLDVILDSRNGETTAF